MGGLSGGEYYTGQLQDVRIYPSMLTARYCSMMCGVGLINGVTARYCSTAVGVGLVSSVTIRYCSTAVRVGLVSSVISHLWWKIHLVSCTHPPPAHWG